MSEGQVGYLRIRVVQTFNAGNAELTNDLPHLHQTHIDVVAYQPGNPGSNSLGSFTIKLHPLGTELYAANRVLYEQLDYYQRVEMYLSSDGASLGRLYYAGIITGIRKTRRNPIFDLTGHSDIVLANLSRPFPGELQSADVTSSILKSYLGTNELGWSDTMSPFTIGNYNSGNTPSSSAGTWTGTTDDGFNVASCATGSGAILISKTGSLAADRWHSHFVEATGRLKPSADTSNAGSVGVGLSTSNANSSTGILGYVTAFKVAGRWNLNPAIFFFSGGVVAASTSIPTTLLNVDDPEGFIPLTIGLLLYEGGGSAPAGYGYASLTVNGNTIILQFPANFKPDAAGAVQMYPYLYFGTPTTGTATCYMTNFIQMTRFTTDGPSAVSQFANGTITTATHSLGYGVDPGPSFLEVWSKLATREGWYWRYTPQAYVVGTRTLGKVDFGADPGTDLTTQVIFSDSDGTLLDLSVTANADGAASGTATTGLASVDGGGISYWRDIGSMIKYGVVEDQTLAFTASDFNSLRRNAYQIMVNKVGTKNGGSKTIVVPFDLSATWRELDRITIDCKDMGFIKASARIIGYTFDEGQPEQTLTLDQFGVEWAG